MLSTSFSLPIFSCSLVRFFFPFISLFPLSLHEGYSKLPCHSFCKANFLNIGAQLCFEKKNPFHPSDSHCFLLNISALCKGLLCIVYGLTLLPSHH